MSTLFKRKTVYILISNVTKALEHEWFVTFSKDTEFEIKYILFNSKNSDLFKYISNSKINCRNFQLTSKLHFFIYVVCLSIELLITRPRVIHCHLFEASLIGLIAAKLAGIKTRISTRHHSDFHHLYHPHAVKYDRLVNRLSTHIIAVSSTVESILINKEQVPKEKITVILHGIPLAVMDTPISQERIEQIRKKYYSPSHQPLIGVISRFVEWKGVHYIIPAFKEILSEYPNALLVLANADGNFSKDIAQLLNSLPPGSYKTIRFENDGQALMKSFDVFVHAPIDAACEAFGQVYIEAMYLQTPMICTLSGIACELVKDNYNALVVNYKDSESIKMQLLKLLADKQLQTSLVTAAAASVRQLSFENKFIKTIALYN